LQLQLLERRLLRTANEPRYLEPIAMVQRELTRLSHLVEDFLCFARPADLYLRRLDVKFLVEQVISLFQPEGQRLGVIFQVELPDDPVHVDGDHEKLLQVLINVVRNALEALEASGGHVLVTLQRAHGGMIHLQVRDNGLGIPEPILLRIFEPFFSTKPMGTGLGLAICHSLVQQHGGAIQIHCDRGTSVDILLPASMD
jgi:signal transduction histidine kinase